MSPAIDSFGDEAFMHTLGKTRTYVPQEWDEAATTEVDAETWLRERFDSLRDRVIAQRDLDVKVLRERVKEQEDQIYRLQNRIADRIEQGVNARLEGQENIDILRAIRVKVQWLLNCPDDRLIGVVKPGIAELLEWVNKTMP